MNMRESTAKTMVAGALALLFALAFFSVASAENPDGSCRPCETDAQCRDGFQCVGDTDITDGKAQGVCQNPDSIAICNPLRAPGFTDIIKNILTIIFNLALVITPVIIVVAGVMFLTAAGDPAKISKAKQMLLWTAVGLVVILSARGVALIVRAIIGF
ncbi:MAG: hypothetical protein HY482_02350 [Candidatus Wildermuthbacteria bacterium]|nr:hypothetical protein [Candidatus Wildermuthbacteria bacterium]